jgi:hypothetical protein
MVSVIDKGDYMKPNQIGGYKLENSDEVMAEVWIARETGSGLDEVVLSRQVWVPTEDSRLTRQADLDRDESETLIQDLRAVLEGRVETRPEYREAARLMLVDHVEISYEALTPAHLLEPSLDVEIV